MTMEERLGASLHIHQLTNRLVRLQCHRRRKEIAIWLKEFAFLKHPERNFYKISKVLQFKNSRFRNTLLI
jgi:hypothetical protein